MRPVILDSEALSLLVSPGSNRDGAIKVIGRVARALELGVSVLAPAAMLAELYRGTSREQAVDACLSRYGGIEVVQTDRKLAKIVGRVLAQAGVGSTHHVDATVVATAVQNQGGVIVTGDPTDIAVLAASWPNIVVRPI